MNWKQPKVYAVKHRNEAVIAASRSRGIFTALSDQVLSSGGIVYGCVLTENFEAVHIRADNAEERNRMRGSKYIQSKPGDTFKNVKTDLNAQRNVLFSGTSCQVAGLKKYLGKEYDNLFCVDIVCHGVPSYKIWKAYLKSDKPVLPVTFDSQYAKDNRDVTFFTQMHPFVAQAAAYESENFPCDLAVRIADPEVEPGDYEFLVYAWRYVGLRPDIRLVAVSSNPAVEKNVLSFIQYASEYYEDDGEHESNWDQMDELHYKRWQEAKTEYSADVRNECAYRLEQLNHSFRQQESIVRGQAESATDDKIKRMRYAQLENIKKKYNAQIKKVDDAIGKVDIHTNLLVRGVLHVD